MNSEEVGKRLIEIMSKLEDLGVFYGKNYGGSYETKYPHSCFMFLLCLDNHRSGFTSLIKDGCSGDSEEVAIGTGESSVDQLLTTLERSYESIIKNLPDDENNM